MCGRVKLYSIEGGAGDTGHEIPRRVCNANTFEWRAFGDVWEGIGAEAKQTKEKNKKSKSTKTKVKDHILSLAEFKSKQLPARSSKKILNDD